MPRKTKEELRIERELAVKMIEDTDREKYPKFLIETLESACGTHEFDLYVQDGGMMLQSRNGRYIWRVEFSYTPDSMHALEDICSRVNTILALIEEDRRLRQMRADALSKLSAEERSALGF